MNYGRVRLLDGSLSLGIKKAGISTGLDLVSVYQILLV